MVHEFMCPIQYLDKTRQLRITAIKVRIIEVKVEGICTNYGGD